MNRASDSIWCLESIGLSVLYYLQGNGCLQSFLHIPQMWWRLGWKMPESSLKVLLAGRNSRGSLQLQVQMTGERLQGLSSLRGRIPEGQGTLFHMRTLQLSGIYETAWTYRSSTRAIISCLQPCFRSWGCCFRKGHLEYTCSIRATATRQ